MKTLLIVDQSDREAQALQMALGRSGFQVREPADGEIAAILNRSPQAAFIVEENDSKGALTPEATVAHDFHQRLFDDFPTLIWQSGTDTKCYYFNRTWLSFTGRTIAQEIGEGWTEGVHSDDLESVVESYLEAFHARKPFIIGYRLRRNDGEYRDIIDHGRPHYDFDGSFVGYIGACFDDTERRQAGEALRESETRFREMAENISEVFWLADPDFKSMHYVSPAYERIWGRSCANLYAKPGSWFDSIHPDDHERVGRNRDAFPSTSEYDQTYRLVWSDGSIHWIHDRGFPVYDEGGHLVRIAGLAEDITERKLAEKQIEQYAEMRQLLTNRLVTAQEDERRHLARELHDEIGQCLTAAKLEFEAAKRVDNPVALSLRLDDGLAVIEQLLLSVRTLSLGLRPPLLDEVGLAAALRAHFQSQAARAGLAVRLAIDESLPRLDAEIEIACFRVAQEALTNVLRHAKAKAVSIELEQSKDELRLLVQDDGVGFNIAKTRAHIAHGATFGLYGMRERVELRGGRFFCQSVAGQGTAIEAYFPIKDVFPESGAGDEIIARSIGG